VLDTYYSAADAATNRALLAAHSYASAVFVAAAAATAAQLAAAGVLLGAPPAAQPAAAAARVSSGAWLLLGAVAGAQAAVGYMFAQVLALFRVLSPAAGAAVLRPRFAWPLLWAGWLLESVLLPGAVLVTLARGTVSWSGITYHKARGRVVRVVH
jgi:hypothetical protein